MQAPRIAVVGAGAIGCTLAWHLAKSDQEVWLAARGATLGAVARNGLELWRDGQPQGAVRLDVTTLDGLPLGLDYLLLCVKQYDLPAVLRGLAAHIRAGAAIVPMVNGVPWWLYQVHPRLKILDGAQGASGDVPLASVIGGVIHIPASLRAPGVVEQGSRNTLAVGEPAGGVTPRVVRLAEMFGCTALRCEASGDIQQTLWSKLMGNAVFNPVSVLANASVREMLEDPFLRPMCERMMGEVLEVGRCLGVAPAGDVGQRMRAAESAGDARPSTLQDALAGKGLEVSSILGAVVALAGGLGVATPGLDTAWGLIRRRGDCL